MNFLKAVVELVYGAGAKTVIIGDSSNVFLNTRQVMKKLGVFDLKNMDKPPWIYIFEEYDWLTKEIPGARYLKKVSLPKYLKQVDKLILLPCLKTHVLTKFTGSLKLSVGFVKRSERISFHLKHVQEKIAELNTVINPDLIIMDARKCFINKGPTHGEIREPGLILASTNRVAIDVEGIKIIQSFKGNSLIDVNPQKLPQIKRAEEIKN